MIAHKKEARRGHSTEFLRLYYAMRLAGQSENAHFIMERVSTSQVFKHDKIRTALGRQSGLQPITACLAVEEVEE